jgi:hypothetical protein
MGATVSLTREETPIHQINKAEGKWTVEELQYLAPNQLLAGIQNPVRRRRPRGSGAAGASASLNALCYDGDEQQRLD